jgi:uncharacterized protein YjeT (DUF2065 family)
MDRGGFQEMTETTYTVPPVPPVPPANRRDGRGDGVATAGIVLIVVGAAFLVARLVPEIAFWSLWPLLFVIGGIVQLAIPAAWRKRGVENLTDALGTMLFGVLLLGNTTGVIPWSMWLTFFSLWPVLLIAAGIAILGAATHQTWIRLLSPLVIWATLLFAAWSAYSGMPVLFSNLYLTF